MQQRRSGIQRPQRRHQAGPQNRADPRRGRNGAGGGNARQNYERYLELARDAARRGDPVEAENCYQHAEHYFRVMREHERERRD